MHEESESHDATVSSDAASNPGPDTNLDPERLKTWFNGAKDQALATYAFGLIEARFAEAGLQARLPEPGMRLFVRTWSEFCWHLFYALYAPIYEQDQAAPAAAVIAELAALCLLADQAESGPGQRVDWYATMLGIFEERNLCDERLLNLLPAEMRAQWPGIQTLFADWRIQAERHEDELFRMGQHGY